MRATMSRPKIRFREKGSLLKFLGVKHVGDRLLSQDHHRLSLDIGLIIPT